MPNSPGEFADARPATAARESQKARMETHMRRIALAAAGAMLVAAATAGCSSYSSPSSHGTSAAPFPTSTATTLAADTIVIQNFAFHPADAAVAPGSRVRGIK